MDVLLRRILRASVRRGLAGDWTWALIALCAFVLRRSLNERGGVVSSVRISPGERVMISVRNYDDPVFESEDGGSRADKRRAKQRAKESAKRDAKASAESAKRDAKLRAENAKSEAKLNAKNAKRAERAAKGAGKSAAKSEGKRRGKGKAGDAGGGAGAGSWSADAVDDNA
jgi:hypothetical protein